MKTSEAALPPLVLIAGGLASGCFLIEALSLSRSQAWIGLVACGAAGLLALWRQWPRWSACAIFLAAVSLGFLWVPPPARLPTQLWEGSARVERVLWHNHSQGARVRLEPGPSGPVLAVLPPYPPLRVADVLSLRGRLEEDRYQGRAQLRLQVVQAQLHTAREDGARGFAWRAIATLPEHQDLAAALLLGQERPAQAEAFRRAGLAHLLAVSGLHIGFALLLVHLVLQYLPLPWWLRPAVVLAACAGYVWLTQAPLPTQRAAIMVAVWQAGFWSARRLEPLAVLAWSILILLVLHPEDGQAIGFQLSVAAVGGILTLGRVLMQLRSCYWPLQAWPLDWPIWRAVLWCARGLCDAAAIGVSASVATAPLIAWHFHTLTPWGVIATLIAGPITALILCAGLPWILLCGLWADGPWYGLRVLVQWSLQQLNQFAQWSAAWPGATIEVPAPPLWLFLAWYFACGGVYAVGCAKLAAQVRDV